MKVFIIFLALLIINLSFVVYQGDMSSYMREQKNLKALAEEGAAGAALYFDEEHYGNGEYIFNYEECQKSIEFLIEKKMKTSARDRKYEITYNVGYEDDLQGYEEENIPAITLTLKLTTQDMFKLPFLEVQSIVRKAKYELPDEF